MILSQSFAILASNTSVSVRTNTAYSLRLEREMANKDLTICGGRSKSLDESSFQFHLEAKCLQARSHSSAFLVIKSGCGWIWGEANNYEIQIQFSVDTASKVTCSHMHLSPPSTCAHLHTCTLYIPNTVILYLWNRWKISPASIVVLQLGFSSPRVLAPVWPTGHCIQGFALTDSLNIKD